MASSIAWFGSEESSPYRRIILGLSIYDIFQSLSFLFGPMAVPISKTSKVAEHEVTSCRANGFVLQITMTGILLHTAFLCVYYLCKLKYRMSNEQFKYKVEKKLRAFIIVFSFISGTVPLTMDAYHINSHILSICNIAKVPTGCDREPEIVGECDSAHEKKYETLFITFICGVFVASFVVIATTMILLQHHTFVLDQMIRRETRSVPTSLRGRSNSDEDEAEVVEPYPINDDEEKDAKEGANEERETPQDRVQRLSRLYRNEMMYQAISYVGVGCLMHIPAIVGFIGNPSVFALTISVIFYPLGGFLNILVYTRPKVAELRRRFPECSRLRGFWIVLKTGGEIPKEVDLTVSCYKDCCRCRPSWLSGSEYDYDFSSWSFF